MNYGHGDLLVSAEISVIRGEVVRNKDLDTIGRAQKGRPSIPSL
jgi:hypothetical protein